VSFYTVGKIEARIGVHDGVKKLQRSDFLTVSCGLRKNDFCFESVQRLLNAYSNLFDARQCSLSNIRQSPLFLLAY
jgi:hypothetical protein